MKKSAFILGSIELLLGSIFLIAAGSLQVAYSIFEAERLVINKVAFTYGSVEALVGSVILVIVGSLQIAYAFYKNE